MSLLGLAVMAAWCATVVLVLWLTDAGPDTGGFVGVAAAGVGGLLAGSVSERRALRHHSPVMLGALATGVVVGTLLLVATDLDGTLLGLVPLAFVLAAAPFRSRINPANSESR